MVEQIGWLEDVGRLVWFFGMGTFEGLYTLNFSSSGSHSCCFSKCVWFSFGSPGFLRGSIGDCKWMNSNLENLGEMHWKGTCNIMEAEEIDSFVDEFEEMPQKVEHWFARHLVRWTLAIPANPFKLGWIQLQHLEGVAWKDLLQCWWLRCCYPWNNFCYGYGCNCFQPWTK